MACIGYLGVDILFHHQKKKEMKKYIFMTAMSMIVTGAVFAQEAAGNLSNESTSAASAKRVAGTVTGLFCSDATPIVNLKVNRINAVFVEIPYEGGNGGSESVQLFVPSAGVLGLTANVGGDLPGFYSLNYGNGMVRVQLSGLPLVTGVATFAIVVGGKSCTLNVPVVP